MAPTLIDIDLLKENPDNPRTITDAKFAQLVTSVKNFPQMLEVRPIAFKSGFVVLGGNMRLRACKEAGLKEVPAIDCSEMTEAQQREFIIKDNVGYGAWDWEAIQADWPEAEEWGLEVPKDWHEPEQEEPSGYEDSGLQWFLNVRCNSEKETQSLYDKLTQQGYDCKIIT